MVHIAVETTDQLPEYIIKQFKELAYLMANEVSINDARKLNDIALFADRIGESCRILQGLPTKGFLLAHQSTTNSVHNGNLHNIRQELYHVIARANEAITIANRSLNHANRPIGKEYF